MGDCYSLKTLVKTSRRWSDKNEKLRNSFFWVIVFFRDECDIKFSTCCLIHEVCLKHRLFNKQLQRLIYNAAFWLMLIVCREFQCKFNKQNENKSTWKRKTYRIVHVVVEIGNNAIEWVATCFLIYSRHVGVKSASPCSRINDSKSRIRMHLKRNSIEIILRTLATCFVLFFLWPFLFASEYYLIKLLNTKLFKKQTINSDDE